MKYELLDVGAENAVIKVIGVGGGGGNAVNHMVEKQIDGVQFICANTDAQALKKLNVDTIIQLGAELTKGLGAGTDPNVGQQAAEENRDRIREVIQGADMVFLTAGMGGGTGTGAIPIIAEIAKDLGILTVAVVTKPFHFEGKKKMAVAEQGIVALEKYVDSLITIPNQKLLPVLGNNISLMSAFSAANNVLLDAVQGITELITHPGMINVDFADVRTVMSGMGAAIMGTGSASGENRAREAAEKAIACPLLEDINLQGARGILVNISAADMMISEFDEVGNIVHEFGAEDAIIKIGTAIDPTLGDEIKVTVVATGMGSQPAAVAAPIKLAVKQATADNDYTTFEKPTVIRQNRQEPRTTRFGAQPKKDVDMDYLDIPAFLRRQAD
ncbi:MAG: cell division protein FtsZ [Gammaproteobacteria bacterium HGW-Gammaproteobacteria-10]|uniref:Cell division protein FtsZ n=1 Tax=Methylotuvimicrobium buryatense TaxID=95641 RepID=A0A4P9URU4_METBY|nr:cell division protein FtsZ [Methylotuvimicrobium buryatense]PKM38107.1 MAG: cell division protein FtsZ [Gammaproteobacteria bacterium HGW-Gammaproteobacteria-10]QCW84208.1 cell division protein FtsZ [Methylotuvimicrobium buryatense]HBA65099.1 cell division protein FtsZ [Methylococcaceae bacterium]